ADGGHGGLVEAGAADVADGIVLAHVEGEVGAQQDAVGAVEIDQGPELVRGKHDRVEVEPLQIGGGRLGQGAVRIRPCTPGVIDAPGVAGKVASAVDGQDLQTRVALEHAVEDQVVQGDG